MIVRETNEGALLIPQESHAHLAGEFAARLLAVAGERSAFVAAARLHDNGWREADAEPLLNASRGLPHAYSDMPDAPYLHVWQRGVERAVEVDPYVGLLVSLHGARFFRKDEREEARRFRAAQHALQDDILARLEIGGTRTRLPEAVAAQSEWIRFLDGVSLFACGEWRDDRQTMTAQGESYALERDASGVRIAPFPFTEVIAFRLSARLLPHARCEREADLRAAFSEAPTRFVEGTISPL